MIEISEDSNEIEPEVSSEEVSTILSVTDAILQKISELEIVTLLYTNSNGTVSEKHFIKNKKSFYNKKTKKLTLTSYVDNIVHTISISDVLQVGYPTTPEQIEYFSNQAEQYKTEYAELSSMCSSDYCLEECFFDPNLTDRRKLNLLVMFDIPNISEYKNASPTTIEKAKNKFIMLVNSRAVTEKEKIQKEFQDLASSEQNSETINEELNSILEFITQIQEETLTKLNDINSIEDLINAWPPVLGNIN